MCGIIGVVDLDRVAARQPWQVGELAAVEMARDGMRHRGPDGAGLWHAPGIAFGHRRLAILDLSPGGHQPMVSPGGSVLTFNGEIYNYLEIKAELLDAGRTFTSTSDTEVLLQALDTWGLSRTLARIRGMYAFAWWDGAALHLARDPIGKKPLYWHKLGQRLAFSSALDPLAHWLAQAGVALAVDPVAVEHHLAGGYIPAPRTIYQDIQKLAAGASLTLDPQGLTEHAPRPIPFARRGQRLDAATLDQLDALFDQAVRRRLRSDVPVATFLSGGLDSSLVTAAAARVQPGITAYTVRTPARNQDEFAVACQVAKVTGVRHQVLDLDTQALDRTPELVRLYGEPFGDSSALPSYLIAEAAGHHHRVILTGDGGDEVQGGYSGAQLFAVRHLLHDRLHLPDLPDLASQPLEDAVGRLPKRLGDADFKAIRLFAHADLALAVQRDGLHKLHAWFHADLRPRLRQEGWTAEVRRRAATLQAAGELDRALGLDFSLYLPEDLCVKVDVAAMGHGVETRAPLLDLDFTDASWRVRPFDRVRPWQTKRVVRALLARHLPPECVLGRKQGFSVPVDHWMQARRPWLIEALRAGLPGMPWLDGEAIAATLAARQAQGEADGTLLWRLWFLQQWAATAPLETVQA
jgi:asparagine synthase (glutamine-hydrolysing)